MRRTLLPLVVLLGLLIGCSSSGDSVGGDQEVGATPTSTPTPTPTPTQGGLIQAIGGGQGVPDVITVVPGEDDPGNNDEQPPDSSDLEFVSADLCDQVPKELVPCGNYDITFSSDSMICGNTPIARQPELDRDMLLFKPGKDGDGEFVDSPVQTVGSDGSLILIRKVDEAAGRKSYRGSGTFPADGNNPERRIEWIFDYDTSAATIKGALVAKFEAEGLGQCTVTKDFEGSPG